MSPLHVRLLHAALAYTDARSRKHQRSGAADPHADVTGHPHQQAAAAADLSAAWIEFNELAKPDLIIDILVTLSKAQATIAAAAAQQDAT